MSALSPLSPVTMKRARAMAGLALLLVAGSACGEAARASSGSQQVPSLSGQRPAAAAAATPVNEMQAYQEVVLCARRNGAPTMPDPVLDDQGRPSFPDEIGAMKDNQQFERACADVIRRLPPRDDRRETPLNPAEMERQRRFVQCLRDNGIASASDPESEYGTVTVQLPPNTDAPTPAMENAIRTCRPLAVPGVRFGMLPSN